MRPRQMHIQASETIVIGRNNAVEKSVLLRQLNRDLDHRDQSPPQAATTAAILALVGIDSIHPIRHVWFERVGAPEGPMFIDDPHRMQPPSLVECVGDMPKVGCNPAGRSLTGPIIEQ